MCTSVHLVNLHNNKLARKTGLKKNYFPELRLMEVKVIFPKIT